MKTFFSVSLGLSALIVRVSGHYIFERFTHGGTLYPVFQYIRQNSNYNSPIIDLTSNDLRCNQGGEQGNSTQTIPVKAGDSFSFTSDVAVYHDGPISIYMAKAPGTAVSFDGSGQVWFKILDIGPTFDASGTSTWNLQQTYTYTIPPALPNGDYLLRIQSLAIHNPYPAGIPQFYIECAQITVTGGGNGVPGPLVSIPGYITGTEPGYTVNIYTNFHNYTVPGPAVWSGQSAGGSGGGGGGATSSSAKPTTVPTTSAKPPATTSSIKTSTKVSTTAPASKTSSSAIATGTGSGAVVPKYGQCGGQGWTGGTVCAAGSTCTVSSAYYSQCL